MEKTKINKVRKKVKHFYMKQRQIIQKRKLWLSLSSLLIGLSVIFLLLWGLDLGIDFTGGSLLEVKFLQERPAINELQDNLAELELDGGIVLQPSGDENMILRFQPIEEDTHQQILGKIQEKYPDQVQEERFESIGPSIGKELKSKAIYAIILVIVAPSGRFTEA